MLRDYRCHLECFEHLVEALESELVPLLEKLESVAGIKETEVADLVARARGSLWDGRKVVVAVVGQVKSGKSTLLNGLLFEGRPQLPTAATPMTARLTVLRANGENERPGATVHFYSVDDWNDIRSQADQEERNPSGVHVYSEIVAAVKRKLGKDAQGLFGTSRSVGFSEVEDYVAEGGHFTDAVKYTEMCFPDMPFEDLHVVDTPGLNDPVRSREAQTLECLKNADAVVFLSSPHRFLDREDMQLVLRDMVRSGLNEVLVVVPQVDTLDPVQREDFVANCLGEMSRRAANFARESGFGPMAQELAANVFVPENTVMVSAMAYALALRLKRGEQLSEDEGWILSSLMKRNGWPVESPDLLLERSNMDSLAARIDRQITRRKGQILLSGPVQKICARVNEIAAQNERRLAETQDDLQRIHRNVEARRQEKEAELRTLDEFNDQAEGRLGAFQRKVLAHPEWSSARLAPPHVNTTPWFSCAAEESAIAEEIVLIAGEELRNRCNELLRHYRAGLEELQDALEMLLPSLKSQNALMREMNVLLSALSRALDDVLDGTTISVDVTFSYSFWQKLLGGAEETATGDVARACRRAEEEIVRATKSMQDRCNAALVESIETLRGRLQGLRSEKQRKIDELERGIVEGEAAREALEMKYKEQVAVFQALTAAIGRIGTAFDEFKRSMSVGQA